MQRLLGSLGVLGSGLFLVVACSADASDNFFNKPDAGGLAELGGRGGNGGSSSGGGGGLAGRGGAGAEGMAGSVGVAGSRPDAGSGPGAGCGLDGECDDQNACTIEHCEDGACVTSGFAAQGYACGSSLSGECTDPDRCDGVGTCQPSYSAVGTPCGNSNDDECANPDVCSNGVCLANDEANGTTCTDGSCAVGLCVTGQPVGCPTDVVGALPFTTGWSSVGKPDLYVGGCDSGNTPEYALVFTAPAAATFRFAAVALVDGTAYTGADQSEPFTAPPDGDAVLTIAEGSCAGGAATQLGCNDDVLEGNRDSQLELVLTQGQVVTVYLNELTQVGGGTGTLTITQLP